MRILVVEDTASLAQAIATALRACSYAVDVVETGDDADAALSSFPYDVAILDLSLPGMDGLEVLARLRGRGDDTPVLILTARGLLEDRVKGLDLGADDYLTKPFEIAELEARVRALIRRQSGRKEAVLKVGGLSFDTVHRTVEIDDEHMQLPRRELALLEALLYRAGRVVSKETLVESLTDFDSELSAGAVELYISRLRKRLCAAGINIRALRGLGYVLEEP